MQSDTDQCQVYAFRRYHRIPLCLEQIVLFQSSGFKKESVLGQRSHDTV